MEKRFYYRLSLILVLASCGARQDGYEITYFDKGYKTVVCDNYLAEGDFYDFAGRCVHRSMIYQIKQKHNDIQRIFNRH